MQALFVGLSTRSKDSDLQKRRDTANWPGEPGKGGRRVIHEALPILYGFDSIQVLGLVVTAQTIATVEVIPVYNDIIRVPSIGKKELVYDIANLGRELEKREGFGDYTLRYGPRRATGRVGRVLKLLPLRRR